MYAPPLVPAELLKADSDALRLLADFHSRLAATLHEYADLKASRETMNTRAAAVIARIQTCIDVVARLLRDGELMPAALGLAARIMDLPIATVNLWWRRHEQDCAKILRKAKQRARQGDPPRKAGPLPLPPAPPLEVKDARRWARVAVRNDSNPHSSLLKPAKRQPPSTQLPALRSVQQGPCEDD